MPRRRGSERRRRRRDGDLVGAQGGGRPHPTDHHLAVARVGDQPGRRSGGSRLGAREGAFRRERAARRVRPEPSERSTRHRRLFGGDNLRGHRDDARRGHGFDVRGCRERRGGRHRSRRRDVRDVSSVRANPLGDGSRRERAGQRRDLQRVRRAAHQRAAGLALFRQRRRAVGVGAHFRESPRVVRGQFRGFGGLPGALDRHPSRSRFVVQGAASRRHAHGGAPGEFRRRDARHAQDTCTPRGIRFGSRGVRQRGAGDGVRGVRVASRRVRGVSVPRLRVSTQLRRILRLLPDGSRRRHGVHRVSLHVGFPVARGEVAPTST